jgi:Protein of unknown function (DUF2637)
MPAAGVKSTESEIPVIAALFSRTTLRRLLVLIVIAVATVWSFDALRNLAHFLGFGKLSWMFPLCIDAVAAIGMDYWMTRSPAWRGGRLMALAAIGVSTAGNATDWLLRNVHPLAPLFGIIPPLALAWVMGIWHRNTRGMEDLAAWLEAEQEHKTEQAQLAEQARQDREARRRTREPKPRAIEPRPHLELTTAPRELPASDEARLARLLDFAQTNGRAPTKREAMELLGVGSDKALRLTRTVRETTETIETDGESA